MKLNPLVSLEPSPTLGINEQVKALWERGETVYHFGFGESRFPVHPKLLAALTEGGKLNSYLPVQGMPALREGVAAYYGERLNVAFSAENTFIAPGSKPLLFGLIMAIDAPLILPTPSWVSYAPQARLLGRDVFQMAGSAENGYQWSIDDLDAAYQQSGAGHALLIINSPNNPTGLMFSAPFLQSLADYCRANNIFVISDEIYGLVAHGSQPHVSLAHYLPESTAVVGGLSKHLSLGGWRLGKAILPSERPLLTKALLKIASELWSTASAPIQHAALTAYRGDGDVEAYIAQARTLHKARTQHVWSWLNEMGIRCPQPQGGFYMMPDFDRWRAPLAQRGVHTSTQLAEYLLANHRVATLPGSSFGMAPTQLSLRVATSYIDLETAGQAQAVFDKWQSGISAEQLLENHAPNLGRALAEIQRFVTELAG